MEKLYELELEHLSIKCHTKMPPYFSEERMGVCLGCLSLFTLYDAKDIGKKCERCVEVSEWKQT